MKIQINFLSHSSAPVTVEISGRVDLSFWFEEDVYVKWTMDASDGILYSHDDLGLTTFKLESEDFAYPTGAADGESPRALYSGRSRGYIGACSSRRREESHRTAVPWTVHHVFIARLGGGCSLFSATVRAEGSYFTTAGVGHALHKHEKFQSAELYD
ncbi:hypothetical protein FOZ63_014819 [Perkinsus olseni]|uniref:Uncharacterized protein n=1 Tax=Perkinsus olseni TaxID=32597 RepID=A0A7J6T918_PEROL|nr:hypothetical protein FOZ63_014819 [Perkinsus olseni]KAF4741748.1 hypothetical protein FOZ62_004324 [Perkinsus olseni]